MSSIDTINHAHVGEFFTIPVYWPLQELPMSRLTHKEADKNIINSYYLSLGGGSGEHPALIINNDAVVYGYLKTLFDEGKDFNDTDKKIHHLESLVHNSLKDSTYAWRLDQNQWPLESFISINKKMKKGNSALYRKIQDAMALFIIYEMPLEHCLENSLILETAKIIRSNQWKYAFEQNSNPYVKEPTNLYGRMFKDSKYREGYGLQDWRADNNSHIVANKLYEELPQKNPHHKIKI